MTDSTTNTHVPDRPHERTTMLGPEVAWTVYPMRQHQVPSAAVFVVLFLVFLSVVAATEKLYLGAIAVVAGGLCAWRLFVPTHYELGAVGITQSVWRLRRTTAWRHIGSIEASRTGLLVMPLVKTGRLNIFGGLLIPWESHRPEIMECVEFYAPYLFKDEGGGMKVEEAAARNVKE